MMSLFVFATFGGAQGTAQVNDVMFPGALAAWETPVCVGASVTFIPRPIAEEEIRQIPLVEARARMGLPLGFSAMRHGDHQGHGTRLIL
ncbi:MAG: hypothetical protein ACKOAG_09945, partial [Candidatus Kapaibacterium sp.]